MRRLYIPFVLGVLGLYGTATWAGWSPFPTRKSGLVVPASVRQSPGGYRSYTYWRGGK